MRSIGFPELLVILGVAVLLFGGKKIREVGKGLGEGIRNFKTALKGDEEKGRQKKKQAVGFAEQPASWAGSSRLHRDPKQQKPREPVGLAGFRFCWRQSRTTTSSSAERSRLSRPSPRGTSQLSWPGS